MKNFIYLIICAIALTCACNRTAQEQQENQPAKDVVGQWVTDSMAPPILTAISTPKPQKAAITTAKSFSIDPRIGIEAIRSLTSANGLPPGSYLDIKQDNFGNVWFLTGNDQLIKYDGSDFVTYPILPGIKFGSFEFAFDKNNQMIASIGRLGDNTGNFEMSIYSFNGISFLPMEDVPPIYYKGRYRPTLFPQEDKRIWIVNDSPRQVSVIENGQYKVVATEEEFPYTGIRGVSTDRDGDVWLVNSDMLIKYDGTVFRPYTKANGIPDAIIHNVLAINKDSIFLVTRGRSMFLYNGDSAVQVYDQQTYQNVFFSGQALWFESLAGGLQKKSDAGVVSFGQEEGLEFSDNLNIGMDNHKFIWGLSNNAINQFYYPVTTFSDVFPRSGPGQKERGIRSFFIDRQGRHWFGSYFLGVSCLDRGQMTNYSFLDPVEPGNYQTRNNITSITQDTNDNIWMGTVDGHLIKFDGKLFTTYDETNGLSKGGFIGNLFADKGGNIWFPHRFSNGRNPLGAVCFDGRQLRIYTTAQGLCSNNVNQILEDNDGAMWFATVDGVSRLKDDRFTTFTNRDGLADNMVYAITKDGYGNIWFATAEGLSRFDGKSFTNYPTADGLPKSTIQDFRKGADDNLIWMATGSEFAVMRITDNHPDSIVFETYSELDGFPIKGWRDFTIDQKGALWTSEGNNAIKRFDYQAMKNNSRPFVLHISAVKLNNEVVCWTSLKNSKADSAARRMEVIVKFGRKVGSSELDRKAEPFNGVRYDSLVPFDFIPYGLVLPYTANSISFDFAAIDPQFSTSTRFQYRLEGLTNAWTPLNRNKNANFSNLREGTYVFKLKALNVYGQWSEMAYPFTVLPPWWRTWWAYAAYILILGFTVAAFIRWRTRALYKENIRLEQKVDSRTTELKQSLENLKATQNQLIQSEKMASLGELTAGIAHEIQNPLNFVNNFSEVNSELIEDIRAELTHVKTDSSPSQQRLEEAQAILNDLESNQQKINHHGKRADAIVKGMLQHSRSSSGQKEPTDLNALCDEYLRLAYHGMKARDKTFNANLKTDFDENIGMIHIIPQDIGRVLLNLINNALYAVDEKKGKLGDDFEPTVSVSTKQHKDTITIAVSDNGNGIPESIKDKIFQPFFTTKPTGQGTGLGLSLAYDIVKAHGGEIIVESEEGKGTAFKIKIPVS